VTGYCGAPEILRRHFARLTGIFILLERCRLPYLVFRVLLVSCGLAHSAAAAGPQLLEGDAPPTLKVGRLTLHRCHTVARWCGELQRPLDPAGRLPGTISIYFEYYPHSGVGAARGTLVATEGGPGYPATGSRAAYLALFDPLRSSRDVLIMDNRGTGHSGAIDCQPLQTAPALTETEIGACGRALGASAPLYSTTLATDDLAALLDALAIHSIDLYGNSYGTYFAQVFALRHGDKLRSLVLDGAYPLEGPDYAWYAYYARATRAKFNLACERDRYCKTLSGSSIEHIEPALARLRARPFNAEASTGAGPAVHFSANAAALAIVMFGGSPAEATVRELDAAARAFASGDALPLLRLMAETFASVDSRDPTRSPALFSSGLAAAVFCQDPPQIFDMNLAPAQRLNARDRAIARRRLAAPEAYAPFTLDEYRAMPLDYAFIDECVRWPAPLPGGSALPLVSTRAHYPDVPVLVISGELDNMTSVESGSAAAAHFAHARHIVIANSFHVNALPHARSACAAVLVRQFLVRLNIVDEGCAQEVPPVRLVPRFARFVRELAPAHGLAGNQAGEAALRAVSAAFLTAEDVVLLAKSNGARPGVGLRGGRYLAQAAAQGYEIDLQDVRWTQDLAVSGRIDWPGRSGVVRADLRLEGPPDATGSVHLEWPQDLSDARATARGALGGRSVLAEAPAP
jgi:pimeloyl-ACP methyl ester carboxylesterase